MIKYENHFAENLRSLRKSKSWTHENLANRLGVNKRTISAWETGVCEPCIEALIELCNIFDETPENLLT